MLKLFAILSISLISFFVCFSSTYAKTSPRIFKNIRLIKKNIQASQKPLISEPKLTFDENSSNFSNVQTLIMQKINEYRVQNGLYKVKTNQETCSFAQKRAQEIASSFSHDGFRSRFDNKTLPYASYSEVTENIAMTSDYKEVVNMWINSSGHAENMRRDTPFVCVAQNGNYFAYEGWKP